MSTIRFIEFLVSPPKVNYTLAQCIIGRSKINDIVGEVQINNNPSLYYNGGILKISFIVTLTVKITYNITSNTIIKQSYPYNLYYTNVNLSGGIYTFNNVCSNTFLPSPVQMVTSSDNTFTLKTFGVISCCKPYSPHSTSTVIINKIILE